MFARIEILRPRTIEHRRIMKIDRDAVVARLIRAYRTPPPLSQKGRRRDRLKPVRTKPVRTRHRSGRSSRNRNFGYRQGWQLRQKGFPPLLKGEGDRG